MNTRAGSNLNTDHLFTSQVDDQAIGIAWYGSRAYDANLGRFLQPDTIVPSPTNPEALNRYSYVLNGPLRHTDPTQPPGSTPTMPAGRSTPSSTPTPSVAPAPVPAPTPPPPETPTVSADYSLGLGGVGDVVSSADLGNPSFADVLQGIWGGQAGYLWC